MEPKLKNEYPGVYAYEGVHAGRVVRFETHYLDDYKSFGWELHLEGHLVDGDGWYGFRLKDCKLQLIAEIENVENGMYN